MDLTQPSENICTAEVTGAISEVEISGVVEGISQTETEEGSRKPKIVGKLVVRKNGKSSKEEKKNPSQPSTSEMVVASIKCLKKRNGATEEAISKYMEDNYDVSMKARSRHIKQFLVKGVEKGLLEKVGGGGVKERFKMKKEGSAKKATETKRNLKEEPKKVKKIKKSVAITDNKAKR